MRIEYIGRGFVEYLKYSPIEKAVFQVDATETLGKYQLFFRDGGMKSSCFDGKLFEPVYCSQYGVPPSQDGTMLFWGSWEKGLYAVKADDGSVSWHYRRSRITDIFVFSKYLVALRSSHALLKFDLLSGAVLCEMKGTSFIKAWRLDDRYVLIDGKYNKFLLVDTETMEVVKTYPFSMIDTGQCLHPVARDAWVEDGRLMVEGFEDDPSTGPHEIKPGISFIRYLGEYEIGEDKGK